MVKQLSGVIGGLIIGPLLLVPVSNVIGMSSAAFWSLVITVALCIWSGVATGPDDLISFAVSRGLSGVFCQIPQVVTSGFIINTFFLHERGKAFAVYSTTFTLGIVVGATFCGVIIQHSTWPVNFWWLVASNGFAALLILLFMEETGFDRTDPEELAGKHRSRSWVAGRIALFLPGNQVMKRRKRPHVVRYRPLMESAELDVFPNDAD